MTDPRQPSDHARSFSDDLLGDTLKWSFSETHYILFLSYDRNPTVARHSVSRGWFGRPSESFIESVSPVNRGFSQCGAIKKLTVIGFRRSCIRIPPRSESFPVLVWTHFPSKGQRSDWITWQLT